jgi:RNA-binding protein 26
MLIDDEVALREWLVATLEPLYDFYFYIICLIFFFLIRCDAEPIALARYVLALVAKDKPLDKLRENCIDRLEVFLDRGKKKKNFVFK